jgi:hypothetical protein
LGAARTSAYYAVAPFAGSLFLLWFWAKKLLLFLLLLFWLWYLVLG